jgi:hypothetical protein
MIAMIITTSFAAMSGKDGPRALAQREDDRSPPQRSYKIEGAFSDFSWPLQRALRRGLR